MVPPEGLFLQPNEPSFSECEDDAMAPSHDHIGVRFLYKSPSLIFKFILLVESSLAGSSWTMFISASSPYLVRS